MLKLVRLRAPYSRLKVNPEAWTPELRACKTRKRSKIMAAGRSEASFVMLRKATPRSDTATKPPGWHDGRVCSLQFVIGTLRG